MHCTCAKKHSKSDDRVDQNYFVYMEDDAVDFIT